MSRQVNRTRSEPTPRSIFALRLNQELGNTTSEAFARQIDVSLRTVQRWRAGTTQPSGADLILIAKHLECDPSSLYAEPEEMAA